MQSLTVGSLPEQRVSQPFNVYRSVGSRRGDRQIGGGDFGGTEGLVVASNADLDGPMQGTFDLFN